MKMENIKVVGFWGRETNSAASHDACIDGGGYFQPCGGIVAEISGMEIYVKYWDLSMGLFGDRIFIDVAAPKISKFWNMVTQNLEAAQRYNEEIQKIVKSISGCLDCDGWQLLKTAREAVNIAAYKMEGESWKI